MTRLTETALVDRIRDMAYGQARLVVGIAGAPGAGKSTVAARIADQLGPTAAVLPMDGFHMDNAQLEPRGLLPRKGAPETFDVAAFTAVLRQIRTTDRVSYPTFDRATDQTRPDTGRIEADTSIVLVEGNYLLLQEGAWAGIADLMDLTVALDVPRDVLEQRLIQRWLDHGLSPDAARARAIGNDIPNAIRVMTQSRPADVTLPTGGL